MQESVIYDTLKKSPRITQTKLYVYESLTLTKTVMREILVKRDVPDTVKKAVALR